MLFFKEKNDLAGELQLIFNVNSNLLNRLLAKQFFVRIY